MSESIPFEFLQASAEKLGLTLSGALDLRSADSCLQISAARLRNWQAKGFAGEMKYMQRGVELFSTVKTVLPEARSSLFFIFSYAGKSPRVEAVPAGYGKVARYAWGRDYHQVIREKLQIFLALLEARFGPCRARAFSDAVPILERSLAQRAAPGFIGKNSLLIKPGIGSYTFLAEIIWDREVSGLGEIGVEEAPGIGCGSCSRCLESCPTDAFAEPGVLDAKRCISYLTIELRRNFSEWESRAVGDWLFGCDVCQEVCPFNHSAKRSAPLEEFSETNGSGRAISLLGLFAIPSEAAFRQRFAATALSRAGRSGLLRNACAVAANQAFIPAVSPLLQLAESDPNALVRFEARRALLKLQPLLDGSEFIRVKAILRKLVEHEPLPVIT